MVTPTQNADHTSLLDAFLAAPSDSRRAAFKPLQRALKNKLAQGHEEEVIGTLRALVVPSLDYTTAQSLLRLLEKLRLPAATTPTRVAVLGSFTTTQLCALIELHLFAACVDTVMYESEYGVLHQEILDPSSQLHAFRPDFAFLGTSWRDLNHTTKLGDTASDVQDLVEREYASWAKLWGHLHESLGVQIIQNSFSTPPWQVMGNHERRCPTSQGSYIRAVNRSFFDRAPEYVTIHDVGYSAAGAGSTWADERFFHHAKLPCTPESLVNYAHGVSSTIAAHVGRSKKCLVLDLDNTLWGGVVGDDGLSGIRVGPGDPESEAFAAFQGYVAGLRGRGVILAVCSANDEANAKEPFDVHAGMQLRLDDISCFVANWEDKVTNLRQIAKELNIGLDAMVFFDDDPAQRSLVRRLIPELAVPEVSGDPSEYIAILDRHRYFEVISLEAEDLKRTTFYRGNVERTQLQAAATDISEFLADLQMTASVVGVTEENLERSAQLVAKTNQFNLTTRRHSPAAIRKMAQDSQWLTFTVSLADRFGDNGLISVLMARMEAEALAIDTWVMSCRVLRRGVERFLFNKLLSAAREKGVSVIRGQYVPTPKNGMVADLFPSLGFSQVLEDSQHTLWELALELRSPLLETAISETKNT